MTQTELADIFLGNITTWEEVGCDGGIITVVHRSDGSGTTARIHLHLCLHSLRNGEQKLEVVRQNGLLVSVVKVTLVLPVSLETPKVLSVI